MTRVIIWVWWAVLKGTRYNENQRQKVSLSKAHHPSDRVGSLRSHVCMGWACVTDANVCCWGNAEAYDREHGVVKADPKKVRYFIE